MAGTRSRAHQARPRVAADCFPAAEHHPQCGARSARPASVAVADRLYLRQPQRADGRSASRHGRARPAAQHGASGPQGIARRHPAAARGCRVRAGPAKAPTRSCWRRSRPRSCRRCARFKARPEARPCRPIRFSRLRRSGRRRPPSWQSWSPGGRDPRRRQGFRRDRAEPANHRRRRLAHAISPPHRSSG